MMNNTLAIYIDIKTKQLTITAIPPELREHQLKVNDIMLSALNKIEQIKSDYKNCDK